MGLNDGHEGATIDPFVSITECEPINEIINATVLLLNFYMPYLVLES